ncbi:hypothetical protein EYZ11_012376 [Aspergillus tanneri]|uniref:Uncharacterized protein n=1 Tax=Aspergillus tanneri TaxID=1220188 RepID=A0A4S3J0F2_9EURO|nr:hypothetical protein EYZ11_012376 [Aspergillus tanneri]
MRYENWDVLLFPESSKVPLQEFKTQCFVTKDTGWKKPLAWSKQCALISTGGRISLPAQSYTLLTTFIPSIPPNYSFRVSIHSWEKPRPSRLMSSLLQPDDALLFEIRIFIDGLCVAGSVFGQRSHWPHVIDIDKSGNQDTLRFPPFHQEILEQRYWDAGELHGRIRVVISEGFARPHRTPPFERVKEVVAFAFQHAPLQHSGIAWPNAAMWTREPRLFKCSSGRDPNELKDAEDNTHTHSPTRHHTRQAILASSEVATPVANSTWQYRNYLGSAAQWSSNPRESRWAPQELFAQDTFIDPYVLDPSARHRGARPSCEDVSMPDYTSSTASSRAISSMTGISYEHSKHPSITTPLDEEAYSKLVEAVSPPRPLACGTQAPTNTPSGVGSNPPTVAGAPAESFAKDKSGSLAVEEISQLVARDVSESSEKPSIPPDPSVDTAEQSKLHPSPSVNVKSRKERMSQDNKENEDTAATPHRERDRVNHTPTKMPVRASGNTESSLESRRKPSTGSVRGESNTLSRGEPALVSPAQDLPGTDDLVRRVDLDELLDSSIQLMSSSTVEVAAID